MKLIAKTKIGLEYMHSKVQAYFAPNSSARKMCAAMNRIGWNLQGDETWHVYDYDCSMDAYVTQRLCIGGGYLKIKRI